MSSYDQFAEVIGKVTHPDVDQDGSTNIIHAYDGWAHRYDQDMSTHCMYNAPLAVAHRLMELLRDRKDAKIIDLGAGTGMCGEELHKNGFRNLDALDPSVDMLETAKRKGIYHRLVCDLLGTNKLDIPDATYEGLVLSGTFVPNHATDSCFEEVIRIMKPDGYFVFIISEKYFDYPEFKGKFVPRIEALEDQGFWKVLSRERQGYKKLLQNQSGEEGIVFSLQRL